MCEKRQNVSERLKKENLHSGQEDAPYYTDAPTMPEGVRGVNSFPLPDTGSDYRRRAVCYIT